MVRVKASLIFLFLIVPIVRSSQVQANLSMAELEASYGNTKYRLQMQNTGLTMAWSWESSNNQFSDGECPYLKHGVKGSLGHCKGSCLEEPACTAFNHQSSSGDCVLRTCDIPIEAPSKKRSTHRSYWMPTTEAENTNTSNNEVVSSSQTTEANNNNGGNNLSEEETTEAENTNNSNNEEETTEVDNNGGNKLPEEDTSGASVMWKLISSSFAVLLFLLL